MKKTRELNTNEQRWRAVLDRDRTADGRFFYAVRSTGIYCRPTCSSRRPRRENTLFFDTAEEAERGGFRACKRCRPGDLQTGSPHYESVLRACRQIERSEESISLRQLADDARLSPHHFQRVFTSIVGVSPKQYSIGCRTRRFQEELREAESVTGAVYGAGFGSSSRAYQEVGSRIGMDPSTYQRGGRGVAINYAIAETQLGVILIATTERGVCALEFGYGSRGARVRLNELFPQADYIENGGDVAALADAVAAFVTDPGLGLNLPLDIRGTAFQQRVWQFLKKIPAGQTRSYKEIAESIGAPSAFRAVAQACSQNKIALAVPCHRAVRSDGGIGGYRWGIDRKRELLKREARASDSGV